jgi:hypothetical protein
LDTSVAEGFVRREHRDLIETSSDPSELMERLRNYQPIALPNWLDRSET